MRRPEDSSGKERPEHNVRYKNTLLHYKHDSSRDRDWLVSADSQLYIERKFIDLGETESSVQVRYKFPNPGIRVQLQKSSSSDSVLLTAWTTNNQGRQIAAHGQYDANSGNLSAVGLFRENIMPFFRYDVRRRKVDLFNFTGKVITGEPFASEPIYDLYSTNFRYNGEVFHFERVRDDDMALLKVSDTKTNSPEIVATLPLKLWERMGVDLNSRQTFEWANQAEYIEKTTSFRLK